MTETHKKIPSEAGQIMLDTLQRAVADTLEKKRRLGQYAVVWRDDKPVLTYFDAKSAAENQSEKLV